MHGRLFPAVVIAALWAGPFSTGRAAAAPDQTGTGTIRGSVTLTAMRGAPLATSAYGRRDIAPKASSRGPEIRNVVVFLSGTQAPTVAPMRARIEQRHEQFDPQVTVVTTGSTVEFPNADPYFHSVFSLSRAGTFNLGRYRSGESRSRVFKEPGIVKVFCDIHAQMSASIVVLDHPWFATPGADGTFSIANVPAGERTVVAWHERIGEKRERLRVTPGGVTQVTFTLPVLETSER